MMDENELKESYEKEKRMIKRELKKVKISPHKMKLLESVIENTAWMKAKLDAVRMQITTADIVVEYDNGGGQKGIRKNPIFEGYRALWQSYMIGMGRILDAVPEEKRAAVAVQMEADKPGTVLDQIMAKRAAR